MPSQHLPNSAAFSARQVAQMLGVHPSTVARWCAQGVVAASRLSTPRGRWRIRQGEAKRLADLLAT